MKKTHFLIFICLFYLGCELTELADPTKGANVDNIFTVDISKKYISANSMDFAYINITLGELCDPNVQVSFETDNGRFAGISPDQNNNEGKKISIKATNKDAQVKLISDNNVIKDVTIKVSVDSYTKDTTVTFIEARPDDIILTSDKYSIKADGNDKAVINIKAYRLAGGGAVSNNIKIDLSAEAPDTTEVYFPEICFLNNETAQFSVYSINHKPGDIIVNASIKDDNDSLKVKSIQLKFIEEK